MSSNSFPGIRYSLRIKVYSIALGTVLILFVLFASILIPEHRNRLFTERKDKLKSAVDIVNSLILDYEAEYRKNPDQNLRILQEECLSIIKKLRYEKNEFFFVLNGSGTVLLHPMQPGLYQWNMLEEVDFTGRKIFMDVTRGAMRNDDIFITTLWQSKYSDQIYEEQILYGRYIWQWDWVVCSSLFTEDIESTYRQMAVFTFLYIILASILIILIQMFFISHYISKPLGAMHTGIIEIKNNNLDHRIPVLRNDELGLIAGQFNRMIETRRRFESQLLQSRKMETVATLASGISHDFNNVISSIYAIASLLSDSAEKDKAVSPDRFRDYIKTLYLCCDRASSIVDQLLSFSSEKTLNTDRISLESVFQHMERLCTVSLDPSIVLNITPPSEKLCVKADQVQLEQTLLNLCINAGHAMTIMKAENEVWGGTLSMECNSLYYKESLFGRIIIKDTGIGMDKATMQSIFDPFFSTKEKGEGSGLGLAMAYRIINDHGGFIEVDSEPGKGTEFSIFLPICTDKST